MLLFVEFYVGLAALVLFVIFALLLPKYVSKNDHLYLKLNNQIEKEASRITNSDEITLKRHTGYFL